MNNPLSKDIPSTFPIYEETPISGFVSMDNMPSGNDPPFLSKLDDEAFVSFYSVSQSRHLSFHQLLSELTL
jgi:hypothetical protein